MKSLTEFNNTLPTQWQQPQSVVNVIMGRSKLAATMKDKPRSPFFNDSLLCDIKSMTQRPEYNQVDGLKDMRDKLWTKWFGRQGLKPDFDELSRSREEYYTPRKCEFTASMLPAPVFRAFTYLTNSIRTLIDKTGLYRESILDMGFLIGQRRSNTGYYGFTSKTDWKVRHFDEAWKLAKEIGARDEFVYPMLEWYRSQRNKMRNVFGGSYPELLYSRAYLGTIFELGFLNTPWVHYHPEEQTAERITTWYGVVRNVTDKPFDIHANEFDFTGMDKRVSLKLATETAKVVARALYLRADEEKRLIKDVERYYTSKLLTIDGRILEGEHSTFSGVFITNGIEDYVSALLILWSVYRACEELGLPYEQILAWYVLFEVMGDDSFILTTGPFAEQLSDAMERAFLELAPLMGLEVNPTKQRRSNKSVWFCKRGYDLTPLVHSPEPWKVIINPIYPIDLAIHSCAFPEQGPKGFGRDPLCTAEIPCILQRLDGAQFDPAWERVVTLWAESFGKGLAKTAIMMAKAQGEAPDSDWMKVVRGKEWSYDSSPSAKLIMDLS